MVLSGQICTQAHAGPKMPPRAPAASSLQTHRAAQKPVESCSHRQVMEQHQHGAAGQTGGGVGGAGGVYYREKYISGGFLCISNSCEQQIKGGAA